MNRNKNVGRIISTLEIFINEKKIEIQRDQDWNINIQTIKKFYRKSWTSWLQNRKKQNPQVTDMIVEVIHGNFYRKSETWVTFQLAMEVLGDWDMNLESTLMEHYFCRTQSDNILDETQTNKPKAAIYCCIKDSSIIINSTKDFDDMIEKSQNESTYLWIIFTENYKRIAEAIALRFEDCFIGNPANSEQIKFFVILYCTLMQFQFIEANPDELPLCSSKIKKTE